MIEACTVVKACCAGLSSMRFANDPNSTVSARTPIYCVDGVHARLGSDAQAPMCQRCYDFAAAPLRELEAEECERAREGRRQACVARRAALAARIAADEAAGDVWGIAEFMRSEGLYVAR